ncbi:MAG: PQQ-binding-like beta-propeller repeat protein [Mariniblastus sp.]|nr:PQQ-binding-like beta-propeller repeat protein [Mariniblastus sp.]
MNAKLLSQSSLLLLLFACLAVAQEDSAAQNWPEYRGPAGNGQAIGAKIPLDLSVAKNIKWKTPIHGKAWSSPVIWGDQIWLTTATEDGKKMSALCVDLASGKIVMDKLIHENTDPAFCHPTNSYASPTPVIEKGRVYLHFGSYGTTCLDTQTGSVIWQRKDLKCDHYRGPGSSPILFENLLIVAYDGADLQYVVALDKSTGETIWKTDRDIKYGTEVGDLMKAYCTGSIFQIDGEPVLVYPSAVATIAYHARSGKPIWTAYHGGMNASSRPVMTQNGCVIVTNGMGKMLSVDPTGEGDVTKSHVKWTASKSIARKSSQLVIGKRLFMVSDKGIASCFNPKSGETIWRERIGGSFAASPVFDGEKIMALSESGKVHFFKASDKFESLGTTQIGDGFKASPAIKGNQIVLRSFSDLYCISGQ